MDIDIPDPGPPSRSIPTRRRLSLDSEAPTRPTAALSQSSVPDSPGGESAPTRGTPQKTRSGPRVSPHRANHLSSSDARPFKCPFDTCAEHPGWSSKSSLAGHLKAITSVHKSARHLISSPRWACGYAKHAGPSTWAAPAAKATAAQNWSRMNEQLKQLAASPLWHRNQS